MLLTAEQNSRQTVLLTDASYAAYIQAAYEFCEQEEEEGSVLLYNRNNALPPL